MSSKGQLVGSIVGFAIGYCFGFGAGGAALGGMIGLWLDPPDPPDPPELGDLGINSYVRSMPVPIAYGKNKIYGGVIWMGNNRVEMENEGSRKSPQYSPSYYADFAVAMCEGTISSYTKYMINDKDISDLKDEDKISLSFTEYLGDGSQVVNGTIDAALVSDPSPAVPWRWTAYVFASGKIGGSNALPTFSSEVNALLCEADSECNPIKVVYDFMTNNRYGMGIDPTIFDGSPTTSGSWYTAAAYCEELVDNGAGGTEPRFRYSNILTNRVKGYDVISEILQTCRGFIYYAEGVLKILIANANETPIFYFSDGHQVSFETLGSCTTTRIYADFSAYPLNYWDGDIINIQLSAYYCEMVPVLEQTATYIDLVDALTEAPASAITFDIRKENIIKDSFTYSRKATRDKVNKPKTEFINKADEFRTDYVEEDNVYDINLTDEIRDGTAQCNGIKRKSQAARMNSFFLDFHSYVEYTCSFNTDIVGYFLTVGCIIGITEAIPQWSTKLFRVITLEEDENWIVKVSCLEYIPTVFHDSASPVIPTQSYSLPNPYVTPANPDRFEVFEDGLNSKLYFCFNRPDNEPNWVGVLIHGNLGGAGYEYLMTGYVITPSVKLNAVIDSDDTIIAYDATTMYDSFPASGSFFLGTEEIYYASINDISDQFEGCVRGYNNSPMSSHADTEYCNLKKSNTPYYTYDPMYIGCSLSFQIVSVSAYDIYGDSTGAPTDTITLLGLYYAPLGVSSLEINEMGNGVVLGTEDCHIYWQNTVSGINKGYGFKYGDGAGYGEGEYEGVLKYMVRIYKTLDSSLLHEEEITDLDIQDFNYTVAMNEADNGSVFEPNLTINVYQVNSSLLYSPVKTIITNS